jgi:hypothetical protein
LRGLFLNPGSAGDISSETSIEFQRTTQRYAPEDIAFHSVTAWIQTAAIRPSALLSPRFHSYKIAFMTTGTLRRPQKYSRQQE